MATNEAGAQVPSTAVEAVAAERGVAPTDLEQLLADVIDPKALDRLVASLEDGIAAETVVQFVYCDCLVTALGDGSVSVE